MASIYDCRDYSIGDGLNKEKEFMQWIRQRPCCVCHQGTWNEQIGEWANTVSHVKTKGSGGELFGNVVSMCIPCHRAWEDGPKKNKDLYLELAELQVQLFNSERLNEKY